MVRKLKYHEQKLLRKVDFTTYKSDASHRDAAVLRRYAISRPSDYTSYNRLCGSVRQLAHRLAALDPSDPVRHRHEALLLEKLYDMGVIGTAGAGGGGGKLSEVEKKVTVSAFARRRLGVVMTRLRMAETVQAANGFIEQGHVRVGTEVVTDPAMLVTRNREDFVTWVDSSKIKRNILKYRDKLDDFDLL
ncbi:MAG: u3 small nucleolar ribonucleo imp3 [Lasallia pustulata]|uniref:U3 small nucleolar ribonucleoprotein protein IMP3 n=1 Tax=Lasallia pustulata TaxID=136370 RepID=A0A5M8PV81_9LECA|nr:MAG: u3 small nucleolar ribonucleo imp3 [Lasallia pustulata]